MKKLFKRLMAAALTVCMTMGLMATGAGAFEVDCSEEVLGKKIQDIHIPREDYTSLVRTLLVYEVPVGSKFTFSEGVDVHTYSEASNGFTQLIPVQEQVTSFVIQDANVIYIFGDVESEALFVVGSDGKSGPITLVGDDSGRDIAVKLSKPVVNIRKETLTLQTYTESAKSGYVFVYEVPIGTEVTPLFGQDDISVEYMWDSEKKQVWWPEFGKEMAEQFPGAEVGVMTGGALLPITLNKEGYYYWLTSDTLKGQFPVLKVVDAPETVVTPRTANFSDMNWSAPYVEKAYGYGWMEGMGEGKFDPEGKLTVAQTITLAARLHATINNRVICHEEGPWYQSYVEYALDNGVLSHYYKSYANKPDDALYAKINDTASRMDMIRILSGAVRVRGLGPIEIESITIPDVSKEREGAEYVYNWYREGVVGGKDAAGNFMPDDPIKRGEVAVILCNLLGL